MLISPLCSLFERRLMFESVLLQKLKLFKERVGRIERMLEFIVDRLLPRRR